VNSPAFQNENEALGRGIFLLTYELPKPGKFNNFLKKFHGTVPLFTEKQIIYL
jgi:hypothetical protein